MKQLTQLVLYSDIQKKDFHCEIAYEKAGGAIALYVCLNGQKQQPLSRPNPKKANSDELIYSIHHREYTHKETLERCYDVLLAAGIIEEVGVYEEDLVGDDVPVLEEVNRVIYQGKTFKLVECVK
jgi:hypothetical protein